MGHSKLNQKTDFPTVTDWDHLNQELAQPTRFIELKQIEKAQEIQKKYFLIEQIAKSIEKVNDKS
ncbi:hypothetical protein N7931_15515 [Catenovulum sp. 2E275]|uniref:hypothetical protein n=1 Tax=Catenovulum sp. 2E275 TaxID=2980497 RepID=UPI0021D0DFD4|nr:hypothetical protein [Catenovulum sp. 2E275]MCU4677041.1 hypothetical protein [Catenovulum sp. 2E275]